MKNLITQHPVVYSKLTKLSIYELIDLNILAYLNAEEYQRELEKHLIFLNSEEDNTSLADLVGFSLNEKLRNLAA